MKRKYQRSNSIEHVTKLGEYMPKVQRDA